jgi:hypothetical protein
MNDKLKDFINNMGVCCEIWLMTYNNFVQRGLDHKTALEHTRAFMTSFMEYTVKFNGKQE